MIVQQRAAQTVLVVSAAEKPAERIKETLSFGSFSVLPPAASASEARRTLDSADVDIVIVNTPLKDEFGAQLAVDAAAVRSKGVLIIVKPEVYEQVSYKMEDYGILTLSKSSGREIMLQSVKLLSASSVKLKQLEENAAALQQKLRDLKTVNRAKGLLIECLKMSEADAHRYIEKEAMDSCVKKVDAARRIIEKFEKQEIEQT